MPPLVVASASEDDPTSTDTDESSSADAESVLPSPESALDDFLTDTAEFVYSASRLVILEQARDNIKGDLQALFNRPVAKLVSQNKTSADYTMSHNVGVSIAALAVVEIKADLGLGNSDPAVQGMVSYVHHWKEQKAGVYRGFHMNSSNQAYRNCLDEASALPLSSPPQALTLPSAARYGRPT